MVALSLREEVTHTTAPALMATMASTARMVRLCMMYAVPVHVEIVILTYTNLLFSFVEIFIALPKRLHQC